jgi:hypothetical protein
MLMLVKVLYLFESFLSAPWISSPVIYKSDLMDCPCTKDRRTPTEASDGRPLIEDGFRSKFLPVGESKPERTLPSRLSSPPTGNLKQITAGALIGYQDFGLNICFGQIVAFDIPWLIKYPATGAAYSG